MRLKDVAYINRRVLAEHTDPDYQFRYIDISAVDSLGTIQIPDSVTYFKDSPSRARRLAPVGSTVDRASGVNQQSYLRNANVHWYEIDIQDMATMDFAPDERARYSVQTGDLLVCECGAGVAEAAVWDGSLSPCFYQKSLHRVRARGPVPVEWLMYWLRYSKAIGIFDAEGNLATIPHLTGEQLAEHRIPVPEDGQRRVTDLQSEIISIWEAQRKLEAANALLAERRQALITAATIGEITV